MAVICSCDELGIPNTGFDCFLDPAVATGIWLVPYFDADGNVFTIDCADAPFDKAYFDLLVNDADKSKRLYPLPAVDNVEDVRADSVVFTTSGGVNKLVRSGVRTFTGLLFDSPALLIESLEAAGCTDFGVFFIDLNGNIIGNSQFEADKLAPFLIEKGTIDPTYIKATDDQPSSVQFKFDYARSEQDKNIGGVSANDITYSPSLVKGLLDITATETGVATNSSFVIETSTKFGDVCTTGALKGAVAGDFTLVDSLDVAVSPFTVVESPSGTYTFDFAGDPKPSDTLTLNLVKTGFEMNEVTITTPA